MRKHLRKYLIAHKDNDYKPHILREISVLVISSLAILLFVAAHYPISQNARFRAAVLPAVLVDLANEDRADEELPPLVINPKLEEAARQKAQDMAQKGYFAHISPDGTTPWKWISGVGYSFAYAGENLAVGFFESTDVNEAWLNSPTHRQNIMNGKFKEIGIATAEGYYQGVQTTFVVQMFGTPLAIATPPVTVPTTPPVVEVAPPAVQQVSGVEVELPSPIEDITALVESNVETETILETEQFIAVKNLALNEEQLAEASEVQFTPPTKYASRLARLISSPRHNLNYLYMIIAGFIFLALISTIFREIGKQHPKHILYGLVTLALILSLAYLNRSFIFTDILIV